MLKQVAIVGGVLVGVGAIGMGITSALGHGIQFPIRINGNFVQTNWNIAQGSPIHQEKTISAAHVTAVRVNTDVAAVEVSPGNSANVTAVLSGRSTLPAKDYHLTETISGSTLTVSLSHSPGFTVNTSENITLRVTIPKRSYNSLSLHTNTGKIDVHNVTAKATTVHVETGKIDVEAVTGPVTATSNVGEVSITNTPGPLNLTANTGAIQVKENNLTQAIDASTNTGAITIDSQQPPSNLGFDLQTNLGRVSANLPNASFTNNSQTRITGTLGTGTPTVTAKSNIGAVSLN